MRGLFRGLPASLMGIVPYSGTDLAMFYTLKARWMAANPDAKVRYILMPWCINRAQIGAQGQNCCELGRWMAFETAG